MSVGLIANQKIPAWTEAFEGYAEIVPYLNDFSGDYDDPNLSANPANNIVKNNLSYITIESSYNIDSKSFKHNIDSSLYTFSEVIDNPILQNKMSDFNSYNNDDYTLAENSKAKELCPDFKPIPFDEIGRIK